MVADDEEPIRQVVAELLSPHYDLVGIVANGRELVEGARTLRPHLVIVDITMPDMNGFEAVSQMRSDGIAAKIVFFTANGSPIYVRKALSLGATGYVLKAVGMEELLEAVEIVLNGGTFISPCLGIER